MKLSTKNLQAGQARAYEDSLYIWDILVTEGEPTDAELWRKCQILYLVSHRDDSATHNGRCGFPFGLDSYGSLTKVGDKQYLYKVTSPYCD